MRSKRERLPIIEAFILTGLLVDFVSHPSLRLNRVPPMPLVQALGHESVATEQPLLVGQTERQHQYLSALVKGDRFQQNAYPFLLSGVSDYLWQCTQAQSLELKHSRYYSSY
jgi:hypothetical protein